MGQALYRKYRSRNFDEVVGQEHITKTLSNAINSGRISHAYLFTGPRGVGKTSVARILAHQVNGLKYDSETMPLDIIEIDAASNRRIDEIRDLRDKVHIAPTSAKYKVYIIDEVHMLTREAFNALLKTLEEPPAHCIFVLATTEAHKLPQTIVSRTQRFVFRPIEDKHSVSHLRQIAKKEKVDISDEALQLIAAHGEGSFRDSISLLDQLRGVSKRISEATVREVLGFPPRDAITKLVAAIEEGDLAAVEKNLESLWARGSNPSLVAQHIGQLIRERALAVEEVWMFDLLKQLVDVPASSAPLETLEISLLQAAAKNSPINKAKTVAAAAPAEVHVSSPAPGRNLKSAKLKTKEPVAISAGQKAHKFDLTYWPEVVSKAKTKAASLHSALKIAKPMVGPDGALVIAFEFPLHQKKVAQAGNLKHLSDLIKELCGATVKIECVVDKTLFTKKPSKAIVGQTMEITSPVKAINNIFGKAEMLEL